MDSLVNKMVKSRGCYMITEDSNGKHLARYSGFDFDKKKITFWNEGKGVKGELKRWEIYKVTKGRLHVSLLKRVSEVLKELCESCPESIEFNPNCIRVICRGFSDVFIIASLNNHIGYDGICFAVKEGKMYLSAKSGDCWFRSIGDGESTDLYTGTAAVRDTHLGFKLSKFTGHYVEVSKELASKVVAVSGDIIRFGFSLLEFPVLDSYEKCTLLESKGNAVVTENILEDIQFYFSPFISSDCYDELIREAKKEEVTGYGLDYKSFMADAMVEKVKKYGYIDILEKNKRTLGYDILYPVGDGSYVFLDSTKRSIQKVCVREVVTNAGDFLFYAIVVFGVSVKYGFLSENYIEYVATSLNKDVLQKSLDEGYLPRGNYLQVKGISIKNIDDDDNSVTIDMDYRGVSTSVTYSRTDMIYRSEHFPNIGVDCDKFMRFVLKKLGYIDFKSLGVYYKAYRGNKLIGRYSSKDECIQDFKGKDCWVEKYNSFTNELVCKYKYSSAKRGSRYIKVEEGEECV